MACEDGDYDERQPQVVDDKHDRSIAVGTESHNGEFCGAYRQTKLT